MSFWERSEGCGRSGCVPNLFVMTMSDSVMALPPAHWSDHDVFSVHSMCSNLDDLHFNPLYA